jgi:cation diffusion facilitator CzcD-associated flavoprotein CzcO
MDKLYDLIIIGAGPSGLGAAKVFLQCQPDMDLLIIDANGSVGGVWAKENVYANLRTNNLRGTIDYSSFRMGDEYGVKAGEHVPGIVLHEYLVEYTKMCHMTEHLRFNTRVEVVEKIGDKGDTRWKLTTETANELDQPTKSMLYTKKLIVATGITSDPSTPSIPGSQHFDAPIIHSSRFGRQQDKILISPSIRKIAVLGRSKSAYDAVHLAASQGLEVEWIIRRSGRGPVWNLPAHTNIGPIKSWREKLVTRRIVGLLSPSLDGESGGFNWLRKLLQETTLGKAFTCKFWSGMHEASLHECGYAKHSTTKLLTPEVSPYWFGNVTGIMNYDNDFYDCIRRGQVRVHREDIESLSNGTINLANGTSLPIDALIAATGFKYELTIDFKPASIQADLGIPTKTMTQVQSKYQIQVNNLADAELLARFPDLVAGPKPSKAAASALPKPPDDKEIEQLYSPWRLYRGLVPAASDPEHSIAFIGFRNNISNTIRIELTSLWIYAYLTHSPGLYLPPTTEETQYSAALDARWAALRSPYGHGRLCADDTFDQNSFFDRLVADLGLRVWRKERAWWDVLGLWAGMRELFEAYGTEDYVDLVGEWLVDEDRREKEGKDA